VLRCCPAGCHAPCLHLLLLLLGRRPRLCFCCLAVRQLLTGWAPVLPPPLLLLLPWALHYYWTLVALLLLLGHGLHLYQQEPPASRIV
jgi:hypothetical protein